MSFQLLTHTVARPHLLDRYHYRRSVIGEGAYAKVFSALQCRRGEMRALKVMKTCHQDVLALKESIYARQFLHRHVVRYHDIFRSVRDYVIAFEFLDMDLARYIKFRGGQVSPDTVRLFSSHLLSGLEFIHSRRVMHTDIKPANCLVAGNDTLKNADLGMARIVDAGKTYTQYHVVTLWYRAPYI